MINDIIQNEVQNVYISNEKQTLIEKIQQQMKGKLTQSQTKDLNQALLNCLADVEVIDKMMNDFTTVEDNQELITQYIRSKRIEGRSERTLIYYETTVRKVLKWINKSVSNINADDIRNYLIYHQETTKAKNVTLNNLRRNLSAFFTWLHEEGYLLTNPLRRIKPIKEEKIVKKALDDIEIEKIRHHIHRDKTIRDLAILETLLSTGVRIGELVNMKITDLDFTSRKIIVFGKGAKERVVFFNAKALLTINEYLDSRTDDNPYLFVAEKKPHNQLGISGLERRVREWGEDIGLKNVHPHRFRRTMATNALNSGMPIEEIKELLGHENVDTTLIYANVSQENVNHSYKKHVR